MARPHDRALPFLLAVLAVGALGFLLAPGEDEAPRGGGHGLVLDEVPDVEADAPSEVCEYLAAAINRFLNSPLKRKQARRTVHQAMKFVAMDG